MNFQKGSIQADAYEAEGQFIVMSGAFCRHPNKVTPSLSPNIVDELNQCLASGILIPENEELARLTKDKAFRSPSGAASFVCGTPASGTGYWKVKGSPKSYGDWRAEQLATISA